tara:strand:- start:686 stop:832 length:147 start_codon:yes stop_codon:yes gene_type:complete
MTAAKAKQLATKWAKKELNYMKNHSYDITMGVGTGALSGFVLFIVSNL